MATEVLKQGYHSVTRTNRKIKTIISDFSVGANAVAKTINGDCSINVLSGNVWIDPNKVATNKGFRLSTVSVSAIDLFVERDLSLISDTTATVQIIIWE